MNYKDEFHDLLSTVIKENASDLHIAVGRHPILRIDGGLLPLLKKEVVTAEIAEGLVRAMTTEEQYSIFQAEKELDFSYDFDGKARFRVNAYLQRGFHGAALRLIPSHIGTFALEISIDAESGGFLQAPARLFSSCGADW